MRHLTIDNIGKLEKILNEVNKDRIVNHSVSDNFILSASNPLHYNSSNIKAAGSPL